MSYEYRHAEVIRVVDGDTVEISIDLGNRITWRDNFRLNGIDAPDADKGAKEAARQYLIGLLAGGVSWVETYKRDKFGRWLADLYIAVDGGDLLVNQAMLSAGFAVPYFGGQKPA